jgi:hypothetical protein
MPEKINIFIGYGKNCVGEQGRLLTLQLGEHKHSVVEDRVEKSELARRAYEEGWDEARIFF